MVRAHTRHGAVLSLLSILLIIVLYLLVVAAPAHASYQTRVSPGLGSSTYNPAAELSFLNGSVHVAWTDAANGDAHASYWSAGTWASLPDLGAAGAGRRTDPSLAWDGTQLWGALNDGTDEPRVKYFDGTNWNFIPDATVPNAGTWSLPSLTWDGSLLWLAWQDATQTVRVSTWDGVAWTSLASPGGGSGNAYPDLEFNSTTGTVWIAWNQGGVATVSEYVAGTWQSRGSVSGSANAVPGITNVNGTMVMGVDLAGHAVGVYIRSGGSWHEIDTPRAAAAANYSYPDLTWTGSSLWASATDGTVSQNVLTWEWDGAPIKPFDRRQLRADDATPIAPSATTVDGASTDINLRFRTLSIAGSQTVTPWVEVQPWGTPFSASCGSSVVGKTFTGDPVTLATAGQAYDLKVAVSGLTPGTDYHWRACADGAPLDSAFAENDAAQRFTVANVGFITGFEQGVLSTSGGGLLSNVAGTAPSVGASSARSGAYGARCNTTTRCRWDWSATGSPNGATVSFWIRVDSLPSKDIVLHEVGFNSSRFGRLLITTTGQLGVDYYSAGATAYQAGATLTAGTWHHVEYSINASGNPWTTNWQVDGVSQTATSLATTAGIAGLHRVTIDESGGGTVTTDIALDDMMVAWSAGAYPAGPITVLGYRPDGMGVHNPVGAPKFTNDDASAINGTSWQRIDELPMTATGDDVRQVASDPSQSEYVEFTLQDQSQSWPALAVRATTAHRSSSTTANTGRSAVVRQDSTESTIFNGDMSETTLQYKSTSVTPPAGGWNDAEIDALKLRVGYSNDVTSLPYWDSALVEVAYQSSVPPANLTPSTPVLQTPADASSTSDTTPDLVARFSDPNGSDTGTLEFEVCDVAMAAGQTCAGAGGTPSGSGSSASGVIVGANGTWTVSPALLPNTTYHWHARAVDNGGKYSGWSASRSLTIAAYVTLTIDTTSHTLGILMSGNDAYATSIATVDTNNPTGYNLTATDENDSWGADCICADQISDWTGTAATPTMWALGTSGFTGLTVRDTTGVSDNRLAKWGTPSASGWPENNTTDNLYAALDNSTSTLLHQTGTAGTADTVTMTWRANSAATDTPGTYNATLTVVAIANP